MTRSERNGNLGKLVYIIGLSLLLITCEDKHDKIITIDNDLPVQVKFYVDGNLRLRIDKESLETLELSEGTYRFSISFVLIQTCNPYDVTRCLPVHSVVPDTTLIVNKDMTAFIRIELGTWLRNNVVLARVELVFK